MPRKPFCRMKSRMSSGMPCRLCRISQSFSFLQSSSVSLSRNRRSSSVSTIGSTARSLLQLGRPENSSASKPAVPASIASCSVFETGGSTFCTRLKAGRVKTARRSGRQDRRPNTMAGRKAMNVDGRHVRAVKFAGEKPEFGGESHRGEPERPHPERLSPHSQPEHGGERQGEENKAYHGPLPFLIKPAAPASHSASYKRSRPSVAPDNYLNPSRRLAEAIARHKPRVHCSCSRPFALPLRAATRRRRDSETGC